MALLIIAWIDVASNAIKQNINPLERDVISWSLIWSANMSHTCAVQQTYLLTGASKKEAPCEGSSVLLVGVGVI